MILHSLIGGALCSTQKPKFPDTSQEDSVVVKSCLLSQREGMLTSPILMAMYLKGVFVKYQRGLLTQRKSTVISSGKY